MAINIGERRAQLDSLNDFIENAQKKLSSVLNILGWNAEKLREKVSSSVRFKIKRPRFIHIIQ
jgi:hypothetical protein